MNSEAARRRGEAGLELLDQLAAHEAHDQAGGAAACTSCGMSTSDQARALRVRHYFECFDAECPTEHTLS